MSQSHVATVLDTFIGLRFWPFAWFSAYIDFRMTHYGNVGQDLRSVNTTDLGGIYLNNDLSLGGFNLVDVREANRSAVYEGFEAGVSFRF